MNVTRVSETPAQIAKTLSSLSRVVVLSHYNPDCDAYGSSCGLALALREQGKTVAIVNESGIIPRYTFIPGVKEITNNFPEGKWDAVIACDCGDIRRTGDTLKDKLSQFPILINIDHHISNDLFGHHNLVDAEASSTAEIIYFLVSAMRLPLSKQVATCLLTGVITDTGSFRYSSTTEKTFGVAQQLTAAGASPYEICRSIYSSDSLSLIKLQAEAMTQLKLHFDGQVAEVLVTQEMIDRNSATLDDTEGLVEHARDIEGVKIAFLISPQGEIWKSSLRSKDTQLDISGIAAHFGGGGHRMAAGFRWRKSLEELRSAVLIQLAKVLNANPT